MCPACVLTGGMIRAGGTSMAAPMVAGAAALLLERYPSLTPNQVKGILVDTARSLPGGLPGLDTYSALKRVAAGSLPAANQGLTPNPLVSAATGEIDYTRSSWSRSTWSNATGAQSADWSRSSWSRSSWSSTDSRRRRDLAVELEPVELVHELDQVAGRTTRHGWRFIRVPDGRDAHLTGRGLISEGHRRPRMMRGRSACQDLDAPPLLPHAISSTIRPPRGSPTRAARRSSRSRCGRS